MKTLYTNHATLNTTPREVNLVFNHHDSDGKPLGDPTAVSMTHETFRELREMFASFGVPTKVEEDDPGGDG